MTDFGQRIRDDIEWKLDVDPLILRDALFAVLDVHKPRLYDATRGVYVCGECTPTAHGSAGVRHTSHPCPTTAAIIRRLDGVA